MDEMFDKVMSLEDTKVAMKEAVESPYKAMQLYRMAKETYNMQILRNNIINKMNECDKRFVRLVTVLEGGSAIIETEQVIFGDEIKTYYRVYHDGRVSAEVTTSFDMALINLLCMKTGNLQNSKANVLIARMLQVKSDWE